MDMDASTSAYAGSQAVCTVVYGAPVVLGILFLWSELIGMSPSQYNSLLQLALGTGIELLKILGPGTGGGPTKGAGMGDAPLAMSLLLDPEDCDGGAHGDVRLVVDEDSEEVGLFASAASDTLSESSSDSTATDVTVMDAV